jgi:hypothetical protein
MEGDLVAMKAVRLYIVVGTPGSGKDELVRAVKILGENHAGVVPKHTSRTRQSDDGEEMICVDDSGYDLDSCQITYLNFDDQYGIRTDYVWKRLRDGISQVLVVSNADAIRELLIEFDSFVTLVYVHSVMTEADFTRQAQQYKWSQKYEQDRSQKYWEAFDIYVRNIRAFDHVLIHAGDNEDLYDQIFRLFRAYERGLVGGF